MKRTALLFLLPVFGALPAISQSIPGYAIANAKHYRESGVGNATGRSGSAQLTARALLGQDGNTSLELTTGTFDSTVTPPGSFARLQFKPLDPDGNPLFVQNFNSLPTSTGYYSFNSSSLNRHQQAQLQANIMGIDRRTDVVTLIETVKLRPDLAVQSLHLPESAVVGTPVTIPANIVELNGDSSATTTCQLFVDDALADKATNIYVDAGGSVSCAFSHIFSSTGTHSIRVVAASAAPADWDTANNSASGTINIITLDINTAQHGTATFTDQNGGFPLSQVYASEVFYAGSSVFNYSNTTGSTGRQQSSQVTLYSNGCSTVTNALPYQFPVDVTYTESMDGQPVYTSKATGITGGSQTSPVNQALCGRTAVSYVQQIGTGVADDHTFRVLSNTFYDSASKPISIFQQVESTRNAGDITYFSTGYQCDWFMVCDNPPTNYYMWNTSTETVLGTIVPLGNTWVANLTSSDAGGNGFGGSMTVPLTSTQQTAGHPSTCTNRTDTFGYTYQTCTGTTTNYTLTQGTISY